MDKQLIKQMTKLIEKWGDRYQFSIKNEFEPKASETLAEDILYLFKEYLLDRVKK
jgi:hypothetical protein